MSWVSIRRPRQQVSKGGSVQECVNCVSMPEYGFDCQTRRSKSCVVNDGSLSHEVLRVALGYRSTKIKLFRFLFRSHVEKNGLRAAPRGEARATGAYRPSCLLLTAFSSSVITTAQSYFFKLCNSTTSLFGSYIFFVFKGVLSLSNEKSMAFIGLATPSPFIFE